MATTTNWHSRDEHPAPGRPVLAALDPGDNTGAGLDEVWAIVYWNGGRWVDVNADDVSDVGPWMLGWAPLPGRPTERVR